MCYKCYNGKSEGIEFYIKYEGFSLPFSFFHVFCYSHFVLASGYNPFWSGKSFKNSHLLLPNNGFVKLY